MRVGKKLKRGCALALAVLLGLSCLTQIRTLAAKGIETDKKCSLTISTDILRLDGENSDKISDEADLKEDLNNRMEISVALYRVADVSVSGKYTPVAPFEGMNLSKISSKTKAEDWEELAKEAAGYLNDNVKAHDTKEIARPEGSAEVASVVFKDLTPGLYLVVPEDTYNMDYTAQYQFSPYLTALPSSEYTLTGSGSDDWNYDTKIGLKAERVPLYGKLNITKSLLNYNETLGPATFVFEIEGRDKNNIAVYSNVISITHEKLDSKTVTLGNLPAGLVVTVTEVYSGASYELVPGSAKSKIVTIASDEALRAEISP